MGTCGDFSAMSVNFTARVEYTSRLTFTATAALNGTVIECTRSTRAFGNDTIEIGGWYIELFIIVMLLICFATVQSILISIYLILYLNSITHI